MRSEFTADPRLLELIRDYTKRKQAIPGFTSVPSTSAGDAGSSTFSLRFLARVRPWARNGREAENDDGFRAGIESFAVVGSRAGIGTAQLIQESEERGAFCDHVGLFCPDGHVATASLAPDWYREAASAHLTIGEGNVPIVQAPARVAMHYTRSALSAEHLAQYRSITQGALGLHTRGGETVLEDSVGNVFTVRSRAPVLALSQLPTSAYFVLGAKLQAGALVRKDGIFAPTYRMVPVNAYAQYVIRISAIKDRTAVLTGAPTREVKDPVDFGENQTTDAEPSWLQRLWNMIARLPALLRIAFAVVALATVAAAIWFVAPLRTAVAALLKVFKSLFDVFGALLSRLANAIRPARKTQPTRDQQEDRTSDGNRKRE